MKIVFLSGTQHISLVGSFKLGLNAVSFLHGTYSRWLFGNRLAHTEKFLLFDLFKAFN